MSKVDKFVYVFINLLCIILFAMNVECKPFIFIIYKFVYLIPIFNVLSH